MKPLLLTLGILCLLTGTSQLLRHVYVAWMPPTVSVIDNFDEPDRKDPLAGLNMDELVKRYEDARKKTRLRETGKTPEERDELWKPNRPGERGKVNPWEELDATEDRLRAAIQTAEARNRELSETHFFWWAGLVIAAIGLGLFVQWNRWLGVALVTTGLVEMLYATSPNMRVFGSAPEFDRLLIWKLAYSIGTLVVLIGLWLGMPRLLRDSNADRNHS